MKHFLLAILLQVAIIGTVTAKEVKPEVAKLVAQNMYQQVSNNKENIVLELVYTNKSRNISNAEKSGIDEMPLYYVFNVKNRKGFIIVSGNDNTIPILGYSTEGNFDKSNLPHNFKKWLENYKKQIEYIIRNNIQATKEIKLQWDKLEKGQPINSNKNANAVGPLLSVTWGQRPYVNDLCPYDANAGVHCVTGCPATAMAQIMKYWQYPVTGTGFHSYVDSNYGTLSANFGATTYDWASMPNSVNSPNNAVATLMYQCGVAVEMHYGPTESGGYVIIDSPTPNANSEYAYKTYFGYDASTIHGLKRENYSDYNWIQMMKNDLNASRPIQYAGFGNVGGHTFVCDGYDNNNYFHMNWGWSGSANGFYLINALNPGSYSFNNGQQAVFGIQPPQGSNNTYDIRLYDNITANPNPVWFGSSFTVHTDVGNWGNNNFNGDWTAALFDENYNFVDYIETLNNYTLNANTHYTNGLDFSTSGMIDVLPGSYYIGIFYRPSGGDWVMVGNGSYSNFIPFTVYYSNDIELYQDMAIDVGTTIQRNQAFSVTLDVLNNGNNSFDGNFAINLFDTDGNFVANVNTLNGGHLDAGYYYDDITFSTNGLDIPPGTYMLALEHQENGSNWELSGSTYHPNPIYITIVEPTIQPDIFEPNDSENNAYNLPLNFNNNTANISTNGSNLHNGSDIDFYKINLPAGYNYTITARAHDSYNSGNGNSYTCDVSWLYKINGSWSDSYDDVMNGNIVINNGGTIYFGITPYFTGETGTYLFDIQVSRTPTSDVEENYSDIKFSVYPNPTKNKLNLKIFNDIKVQNIKISDISGKQISEIEKPNFDNNHFSILVNNFAKGTYIISIKTNKGNLTHKFIKY